MRLLGRAFRPLATSRGQGRLSRFKCAFPAPLPPQADIHWHQPQDIGDPRPQDSVLRWTRGARQPSDSVGAEVFGPEGAGSSASAPKGRGKPGVR